MYLSVFLFLMGGSSRKVYLNYSPRLQRLYSGQGLFWELICTTQLAYSRLSQIGGRIDELVLCLKNPSAPLLLDTSGSGILWSDFAIHGQKKKKNGKLRIVMEPEAPCKRSIWRMLFFVTTAVEISRYCFLPTST